MVYAYILRAPGCELDGETFAIQDECRERADLRASASVQDVLSLAPADVRMTARAIHYGTFSSRAAHQKYEEELGT